MPSTHLWLLTGFPFSNNLEKRQIILFISRPCRLASAKYWGSGEVRLQPRGELFVFYSCVEPHAKYWGSGEVRPHPRAELVVFTLVLNHMQNIEAQAMHNLEKNYCLLLLCWTTCQILRLWRGWFHPVAELGWFHPVAELYCIFITIRCM